MPQGNFFREHRSYEPRIFIGFFERVNNQLDYLKRGSLKKCKICHSEFFFSILNDFFFQTAFFMAEDYTNRSSTAPRSSPQEPLKRNSFGGEQFGKLR